MKESWKSWAGEGLSEGEVDHYRRQWESEYVPLLKGSTNEKGVATLAIEITAMDSSSNSTPPASRDVVSGREYSIQLDSQGVKEEFLLVIEPEASSQSKSFGIRIEAISSPKYKD